jgi:NAD(P)H-dependent flavin oxidoreductase YrpB (nitropropane dioxygenase family)
MTPHPLHTRLCDLLGIELPIICFTHCRDVAVAAINAGGFAVLGEAMHTAEKIQDDIRFIRDRVSGRQFGIDLVLPKNSPPSGTPDEIYASIPETHRDFADGIKRKYEVPEPENDEALRKWGGLNKLIAQRQIDVVLEEAVPVIATGLGAPDDLFAAAHARDLLVFSLVGMKKQAVAQLEKGADAIVAQGFDAAGHTGAMGTFSVVPEVVSVAGDKPVIAAGGVTTGRHLAAALCLGASGVWAGTVWLASDESDVDDVVIERILGADGAETTRTPSISGKTMRVLRCPWTEEWSRPDAPKVLKSPYQMMLTSNYLQAANDARRPDLMTEAVGQGVGFVDSRRPTAEILRGMAEEACDVLGGWPVPGAGSA